MRIEPPLNSLRPSSPCPQQPISPPQNPNAPKLPNIVTALAGIRLTLHNNILTLIRENDLDEASLLVRHSIYSNCCPTVFTCNAVLAALLRQSRYSFSRSGGQGVDRLRYSLRVAERVLVEELFGT